MYSFNNWGSTIKLSGSLPVDGTVAKNVLSEISREVQSAGWHFNTHYKSTLTRDTNNKFQ